MNDYHFEYSGKVIIDADTYEEAEKLLKNMMWDVRGVYNYQMINSSVSVPDYGEEQMTEIDISRVLIEGDTATIMGEKYKRVEEPKTPAEEAYKEVYGWYPPTTSSVSNYEDNRWSAFQNGYNASKEDCKVEEKPKSEPKTLTDILYLWWSDVFTTHSDWDMETSIDDLVTRIEEWWLPKEQSAAGSQNAYVECSVEGFNDCLKKIKGKLR
jgi:hypothetical protein